MDNPRIILLSIFLLFLLGGCDIGPENTGLTSSSGLVNKGVMANAEVKAYKAGSLELVKRTYTKSDGTFAFEDLDYQGVIYVEVTTTSQTLATCDSVSGCGEFKNGLKLPGEFDANLDGIVDFGDRHYYNDSNFKLTSFINPNFNDLENFGQFAVTPLTHLAAQRIISEHVGTAAGVDIVNAQVAELFGLDGVDITRMIPPDVTDAAKMADATVAQRMYSTLNAAVASSVTPTKNLVSVINELTSSFVNNGGLVGNSNNSDNTTLASLQSLASGVATQVSANVDMSQVLIKIQQQVTDKSQPQYTDQLVEPSISLEDSDGDGILDADESMYGTNPKLADTDGDGLNDGDEINHYSTNPLSEDSDSDGITDYDELMLINTNPIVFDSGDDGDSDGLTNLQELQIGTDANNSDTDGDGLNDGQELNTYETNPLLADSDADGLNDSEELMVFNSNPNVFDSGLDNDSDGLSNLDEKNAGTDPNIFDTDNDGMPDGWEVQNGLNPNLSSDAQISSDSDELLNIDEYLAGTDPFNENTDGDFDGQGLPILDHDDSADGDDIPDGIEVIEGLALGQDDYLIDFDGDGISNGDEHNNGSDIHFVNPFIEYVSDAEIFYAVGGSYNYKLSLDETQFYATYFDVTGSFLSGVLDQNMVDDFLFYEVDSALYELPIKSFGGTQLSYVNMYLDSTPDDRLFVFSTMSNEVIPLEGGVYEEIYIHNKMRNKTVSLDNVNEFNGGSFEAKITAGGEYLVFSTAATNASAIPDTNGVWDVYLKDLQNPTAHPILISRNGSNVTANNYSETPLIDKAGTRVVFTSLATDLNATDVSLNGYKDLYLYDIASGEMKRISTGRDTVNGVINDDSSISDVVKARISDDGRYVIFYTMRDMFGLGAPGGFQMYSVDLDTCYPLSSSNNCQIELVTRQFGSTNASPVYSNTSNANEFNLSAEISANGQFITYTSSASNLIETDENTTESDVFIWNRNSQSSNVLTQYFYNSAGYDIDPASRIYGVSFQNLVSTSDFSHVYGTVLYGDEADPNSPVACVEGGCFYKIDLHINQLDTDNDGLNDQQEISMNTSPLIADTDNDGLSDGDEVFIYQSSPRLDDSDNDGWTDGVEVNQGTLPNVFDDTDGDGLSDHGESLAGTSVTIWDTDSDGLSDYQELSITNTNPLMADTDGDTINDGTENSDSDGLTDAQEMMYFTIHTQSDTDGDGVDDYTELMIDGTDPLDPLDYAM